jgi:2-dehydro-3-deoxygluconokinase
MPEPSFDVTTFGEMLLRLSIPTGRRLETANQLDVYPAGAEANVVTLLARLENYTCWMGALPKNPLGRKAAHALREAGVDTESVLWRENGRMGTYYVEFGAPPRGIQVTYDRANSCITQLKSDDIDWDALLDSRLLHLTGITPALSPSCCDIVKEALSRAQERGVPVSFDVNYRQKLWTEAAARDTLLPFLRQSEIVFCGARDAEKLFHCTGSMTEIAQGMLDKSGAHNVVITFGDQGAMLWDGADWHHEPAVGTQIVDRLGAGDALAAGVLHGWLQGDVLMGLRYGVTLAAMALSQHGDMVVTNPSELYSLMKGSSSLLR